MNANLNKFELLCLPLRLKFYTKAPIPMNEAKRGNHVPEEMHFSNLTIGYNPSDAMLRYFEEKGCDIHQYP